MVGDTRIIETAPDIKLSVQVAGEGPLVILMHGWPEIGLSYRHQIVPLVEAGYRIAVPDMRGFGNSSKPEQVDAYNMDALADDMAVVARSLDAEKWVPVGHDWGGPVAWRCALRFPNEVAGVFALSTPHSTAPPIAMKDAFEFMYPDTFYYARYFMEVGPAEEELGQDVRASLKKIFFALSGDAPKGEWMKKRARGSKLLHDLMDPPAGPLSFMSDEELDLYAEHFIRDGFFGSLCWYRNADLNNEQARAYPDERIRQPSAFLCGDKEIILIMVPGIEEMMRELCDDLRFETIVPDAGHWIQQERPKKVSSAIIGFLKSIDKRITSTGCF